ncbi:carboxypeptidase t precursor [Stylonychia lemnae]|uniref:Carboxypeptidase t n=1 Tax=Stylonychia lemnae TaxID=5949 RepID=A0A078A9Q6_STYLE|nr:carboxypeptidase t precursor [Stylonychia lemnae]|eukprot:CDW77528.1 carboxypeptidase t precursor [Stylonychia lemnae]
MSHSEGKLDYYKNLLGAEQFQFNKVVPDEKHYMLFVSGHNANSMTSLNMVMSQVSYYIYAYLRGQQDVVTLLKLNVIRVYPLINPDGYEYVRQTYLNQNYTYSYDLEGFVKNRANLNSLCPYPMVGVSLRNNYDYKFGVDDVGSDGESDCQEFFRGRTAFSEVETQAIKNEIESMTKDKGINYSAVIFIESHPNTNALIIPNNYLREQLNVLLAQQDGRIYKFFMDLAEYYEPSTGQNLFVGNTIDIFGKSNNGDPNDWIFQMKKILTMTLFLAAPEYHGSSLIDIELPDLCKIKSKNKFNHEVCDQPSDFYDLYVYQAIDLNNNGRVDTTGNVKFELQSNMNLYKLFVRSSRAMPYLNTPFFQSPATGAISLELPDIERDNLRNIGIICIFHYEVDNITSIQDVREKLVYNELVSFVITFENGAAKMVGQASINLQLIYTYLNTRLIEESLNAGKFRSTKVILYMFYIAIVALNLIWLLQIRFNICRKNQRKDQFTGQSAFQGEVEMKIFEEADIQDKAGGDYYLDHDELYQKQLGLIQNGSTFKSSDNEYSPRRHSNINHLLMSDASLISQMNSKNTSHIGAKKAQLLIDLPQNNYDSGLASGRYLESTRSLLVNSRQDNKFGSDYDTDTQQQLYPSNQVMQDPYTHQAQYIDMKRNPRKLRKSRDQNVEQIIDNDMLIFGKVEKITKEQFRVERSAKGKTKIIKEIDHPREAKRKQLRKIVSNIQEEENENSYFQADQSNITVRHVQNDDPEDNIQIQQEVQEMSKTRKKSKKSINFYKEDQLYEQNSKKHHNNHYNQSFSKLDQEEVIKFKDIKVKQKQVSTNDLAVYKTTKKHKISVGSGVPKLSAHSGGSDQKQKSNNESPEKVAVYQEDIVQKFEDQISNKSSPIKHLAKPEYNNFMEADEILENDDD